MLTEETPFLGSIWISLLESQKLIMNFFDNEHEHIEDNLDMFIFIWEELKTLELCHDIAS